MGKTIPPRTLAALEALYARVPSIRCKRLCGEACGPMILTDLEARRLQLATHRKPRTLPMIDGNPDTMRCVYLSPAQDRCTAHAVRPLICRAWGALKRLSCMHGCVPERWLTDHEFFELALAVERLGGGRVLRTVPEGVGHLAGEAFASVAGGREILPREIVEEEAERVRNLRAIFGGRIIAAVHNEEK